MLPRATWRGSRCNQTIVQIVYFCICHPRWYIHVQVYKCIYSLCSVQCDVIFKVHMHIHIYIMNYVRDTTTTKANAVTVGNQWRFFVFRQVFINTGQLSCHCYFHGIVFVFPVIRLDKFSNKVKCLLQVFKHILFSYVQDVWPAIRRRDGRRTQL